MQSTGLGPKLNFRVIHHTGFSSIWEAMRQKPRGLEARDVAVLFYIVDCTNFSTGKAKITVNQIADDLAMQQPWVSHSMRRLKDLEMVVLVRDRREGPYYRPNPMLTAPVKDQGRLWADFFPHTLRYQKAEAAIEADSPELAAS